MQGWKLKTLGEIAEVQSGGTPLKSRNEYWFGDIPWYSSGELNDTFTKASKELITPKGLEESNAKLFPKGSLLIGMYDTAALKMSILDRDAAFNQAIAGVKPNENIDLKFLLFAINSRRFEILNQRRGVRQKNLSLAKIKNIALPIPSLLEQKRIVVISDEAFEGIDRAIANTEKNLANARELFESYLNAIFTQKNNRWEWVSLSEITTDITDGDHQPPPKSQSGIPFITISNIDKQNRKVDFSNTFKVPPEYFEKLKSNRKPRKGDLLYTVTGSYGIPVIVDHDIDFCFQRHIGLIRPNAETNSKCLYYILLSRYLLTQADECATGTAQKTVSLNGLRRFSVPKIPKEQQEIIVTELDALSEKIGRLESIYRQKIAALNELKQSTLQKAFTGELTADTLKTAQEEIAA